MTDRTTFTRINVVDFAARLTAREEDDRVEQAEIAASWFFDPCNRYSACADSSGT